MKAAEFAGKFLTLNAEGFLMMALVPDSFVEVWFRRGTGYWDDGGAYPLRLEQRSYGWQAFGIER